MNENTPFDIAYRTWIGSNVEWKTPKTKSRKARVVKGKVDRIRKLHSQIKDVKTGEYWPAVEFRIKPSNGSRARWTDAFPDKEGDYSDLEPGQEVA